MTGGVLGIIPARGGSKGIPGKNLRFLAGQPLLYYAVRSAKGAGVIDRLILSTDSEEIAETGRNLGLEVPFLRPQELALDDTPMLPVLEHAIAHMEGRDWRPEVVVLLQPTAPLRRPEHINRAVTMLRMTRCDSVVSVVPVPEHFSPHYLMKVVEGRLVHFLPEGRSVMRRQDAPIAYHRDGTVYVIWRDVLMEKHSLYGEDCRPLILPDQDSVNLDTMEDWIAAERRLSTVDPAGREQ